MARVTIFFNTSKAKQIINLDDRFFTDDKSKNRDRKITLSEAEKKAGDLARDIAQHHYLDYSLEAEEFYVPLIKK